jgi:hypothetical protein
MIQRLCNWHWGRLKILAAIAQDDVATTLKFNTVSHKKVSFVILINGPGYWDDLFQLYLLYLESEPSDILAFFITTLYLTSGIV